MFQIEPIKFVVLAMHSLKVQHVEATEAVGRQEVLGTVYEDDFTPRYGKEVLLQRKNGK